MKSLVFPLMVAAALVAASCDDTDNGHDTSVSFSFSLPEGHQADAVADSATLSIADVTSGDQFSLKVPTAGSVTLSLPDGLYDMSLVLTARHSAGGAAVEETFRDSKKSVSVLDGQMSVAFALARVSGGQGFVFADMCLVSQLQDGLKSYFGDAWFRICNNSADTLFADGLCIVESDFVSASSGVHDYSPDIMAQAMAVQAVYQIPGGGKDVPVLPGGSILIADVAKDHRTDNAPSFDLSKADFEWYDEGANDIDTEVPNLTCVYKKSKTVWRPSVQYNRTYAIGFLGGGFGKMSSEQFIAGCKYDYSYIMMVKETEKVMKNSAYRFENDWILDAVAFAPSADFGWRVVDQGVDAGYVSMGETGADASRRGKSARRRFANGLFADTNNSTDDFEVVQEADPYHVFK